MTGPLAQQFARLKNTLHFCGTAQDDEDFATIERHVQDMEQRAVLRVEKEFESGMRLPEGAPIYARETEHGWIGTYHPEQKSWSSHSFELDPDDFMVLVPAKARAALPASGTRNRAAREKGTE